MTVFPKLLTSDVCAAEEVVADMLSAGAEQIPDAAAERQSPDAAAEAEQIPGHEASGLSVQVGGVHGDLLHSLQKWFLRQVRV